MAQPACRGHSSRDRRSLVHQTDDDLGWPRHHHLPPHDLLIHFPCHRSLYHTAKSQSYITSLLVIRACITRPHHRATSAVSLSSEPVSHGHFTELHRQSPCHRSLYHTATSQSYITGLLVIGACITRPLHRATSPARHVMSHVNITACQSSHEHQFLIIIIITIIIIILFIKPLMPWLQTRWRQVSRGCYSKAL